MTGADGQRVRASGLLLHVTSLSGRYGIGDLGPEAHRFAADLAAAGQRYWQLLPVGPTGSGNSPYSSSSTFAGNPLLISPDRLCDAGLVDEDELEELRLPDDGHVDYDAVRGRKDVTLRRAAERFPVRADDEARGRYERFVAEHGPEWLDDFCLFTAQRTSGSIDRWDSSRPETPDRFDDELSIEIELQRTLQFLFFEQWHALKRTCRSLGVEIVGDLPLYVALDSADVWANPDDFLVDSEGNPTVVAGVPPDYFSATGQRWGNPIYDWEAMAREGFRWWRARVRQALSMFDVLRIDHFRGIAGYWEIPASEPTAVNGHWRVGPGAELLGALEDEIGHLPFIAEDLGVITDDVRSLRDRFGLPGMRVAQFGFDAAPDKSLHHPQSYPENVWAYTGTHDNDTTLGWFWDERSPRTWWRVPRGRRRLYRSLRGNIPGGVMELVARSRARAAVFPVQDVLGLGSVARMNTPGTATGNWTWRLRGGQLDDEAMGRLRDLTEETGRSPSKGRFPPTGNG